MMIRQQVSRALAALPRLRKETVWWAVGEISIVVAGVLIAFALNAWWVERDTLRAEQVHLRSLVTDFEQNVGSLQALLQRQERVERACVDLLRLARTKPVASSDSVRPLLGQVFSSVRFEPVMGAYDALLNSAGLTLIRDDDLRSSLAAFAARMNGRLLRTILGRTVFLVHPRFRRKAWHRRRSVGRSGSLNFVLVASDRREVSGVSSTPSPCRARGGQPVSGLPGTFSESPRRIAWPAEVERHSVGRGVTAGCRNHATIQFQPTPRCLIIQIGPW